jgi:DNA-binding MarR family transcriptional regulator
MDNEMPPPTAPERTLGLVLHDVARFLRKRFEQRAREADLGLTRAQWSVLAHLARHEGINQAALAQILEIEPITLVRLLDRLQAAGLVERRPDPSDRRARVLSLTPAARPLLDRIWALAAVVREEAMAGLDEEEREHLFRMLLKIKANLTEPVLDAGLGETPRQVHHG